MTSRPIQIGQTPLQFPEKEVTGAFVSLDQTESYKISNYDQMPPFFISVVSDTDQWLYISTKGGLTAGRKNPETALFPYYTDDKIHDSGELTGSKTIFQVEKGGVCFLWEPFSDRYAGAYRIERNLYKNIQGNQLIFEEVNHELGLTFSYGWYMSQQYGFVKKSRLTNQGTDSVKVKVLDGLQNLLPYGINLNMQSEKSTLLDAYKKNELLAESGLGLFLLSSIPVDKAEPSEALKATTVWSVGLEVDTYLLSSRQLNKFRRGQELSQEVDARAERGGYFVESTIELSAAESKSWYVVAEINQGPSTVTALEAWILDGNQQALALEADIEAGTRRLMQIVATADGLQKSANQMLTARHFANVMFNVMRGGIFDHNFEVPTADLRTFLQHSNQQVSDLHRNFLQTLPASIHHLELLKQAAEQGDPQLQRLCSEYLPLTFSRRHGDPSRPWNRFSIDLVDEAGNKKLYYEGNWRDIFQNWEALAVSYPAFQESMISKFVNASTADGYNPYRITRNGIDWEVIEEDDPWSFIGYWGDHQIIYLLKLMELSHTHHPEALLAMLSQPLFAYANVPYRIKAYADLLADPHDTIDFDHDTEAIVAERVAAMGADGKLVLNQKGEIYQVNLTEKLLVSLLAKLSNFIPEGGIWLNTQRPEWNDANNALVGNGVSMVTLYYLRRSLTFCQSLFADLEQENISISGEVAELFHVIAATFSRHQASLSGSISPALRRQIVDELGEAGESYRSQIYGGFSEQQTAVSLQDMADFFTHTLAFVDHTIEANRRPDHLYHSYNLMKVEADGGISIRHLYEMLEGQVAVLSAGKLTAAETLEVLQALRKSDLYRADQHSYLLYPNRQLPRFTVKNKLPEQAVQQSELLTQMIQAGDRRLIEQDVKGQCHFNGSFNNRRDVVRVLDELGEGEYGKLPQQEKDQILAIFEGVFDHESFTGRSGTFFGYEGLGSVYWHMVSKLQVAVEENCWQAIEAGGDAEEIKQLIAHYYDVRAGIGSHKSPKEYGAFPFDPYSHTPGTAGAQQPGMTGQVKEDILTRFGELGITVKAGQICFRTDLFPRSEFLPAGGVFAYWDIKGEEKEIALPPHSLVCTYCQVPFVYHLAEKASLVAVLNDGSRVEQTTQRLSLDLSKEIMNRSGAVLRLELGVK